MSRPQSPSRAPNPSSINPPRSECDVVVVGAGPAGAMAAWRLANLGRKVILLERGTHPGSKNLFGGMIYSLELARWMPDFLQHAPIERPVTRHATYLLGPQQSINLDFASQTLAKPPYNGFTAFRSQFDNWLAQRAVQAGALLVTSTLVKTLWVENNVVVGVHTHREQGSIRAKVVICADGVLSQLAKQRGLAPKQALHHYSIGVRETLALPAKTIEERFQLEANGGCAALFGGSWQGGLQGGGFIYTNRESLSVGFVAQMPSLQGAQAPHISTALDTFKRHPSVARLIEGGERLEYGAHMVAEGGWNMRPKRLVDHGLLLAGDAAGLLLAAGVLYEGVHYAMHSGILAAQTAHHALGVGDASRRVLARYQKELYQGYVGRNLRLFKTAPRLLVRPALYNALPQGMCLVAEAFFRAEETGHKKLGALLQRHILKRTGLLGALKDAWLTIRTFFY